MNTPAPIKSALCVPLTTLPEEYRSRYDASGAALGGTAPALLPIPSKFFDLSASQLALVPRSLCESDRSLRQIIPYILLVSQAGKLFTYSRGGAGGEGKLIGNLSVGLGGHVDENIPEGLNLQAHLMNEANRELEEEAKLPPDSLEFLKLIADSDAVGCVHCGVFALRLVDNDELAALELEEGCIENGEWLTLAQLLDPSIFSRLEGWSKLVVRWLESLPMSSPVLHHPV